MSVSTCALSGQPLVQPVVSLKSGQSLDLVVILLRHVFEKELILKHLTQTGQCPITGVNLDADTDLIELKVANAARPKPLSANSVPGIMQLFQSEWDSVMLEVYQLRKNLDQTRKELSQSLYQHDAACRVICRLLKEKDELQSMIALTNDKMEEYKSELASQVHQGGSSGKGYLRQDKEGEGIYKELVSRMEQLNEILSKQRPEIKAPKTYVKKEALKTLHEVSAQPIHESTKPGIIDLDIHPTQEHFILSIGKDQTAILFDSKRGSIVKKLDPFDSKKKQTPTVSRFVPGQQGLFTVFGSSTGSGNLWHWDIENDKFEQRYFFSSHKAAITGVTFQPLNEYAAFASKDGTWSFHNLFQGVNLSTFSAGEEVSSIEYHPDGLILSAGLKSGVIDLWDMRTQQSTIKLENFSGKGEISKLNFSSKGVLLAVAIKGQQEAGIVDLRKTDQTIPVIHPAGSKTTGVAFDFYGNYLLTTAGESLNLFAVKQWEAPVVSLTPHKGNINVAKFSPSGNYIVSGGEDRFLKIFSF